MTDQKYRTIKCNCCGQERRILKTEWCVFETTEGPCGEKPDKPYCLIECYYDLNSPHPIPIDKSVIIGPLVCKVKKRGLFE